MLISEETNLNTKSMVFVQCDYRELGCKGIVSKTYHEYIKQHNKNDIYKDCCNNVECMKTKRKESLSKRYGVENVAHINAVQEKRESTCVEKYGNKTPLMNKEVIKKSKITLNQKYNVDNISKVANIKIQKSKNALQKYGVENVLQSEEIKEKIRTTNLEKYGVDNYVKTKEYKIKTKNTNMEKYGFEWANQNQEIIQKRMKTLRNNSNAPKSNQQVYLCALFDGILNYQVNNCFLDILLENNIFCEYDGGGHSIQVKFGNLTEKEFNKKELKRELFLHSKGYKMIRIISIKDKLPSNKILLEMLQYAKEYLNSGHSWIKFDIDNSQVTTSQYTKFYDFGKLRKIKEKDLSQQTA
jgi:hypothetical protein